MQYNEKDFKKMMKANGYTAVVGRGKGSHTIYRNGSRTLSISNSYNKMIIKRLIKEYGLVEV